MSTEIGPNKFELFGKIILQVALIAGLFYFIYVIINPKEIHHFHEQIVKDRCFVLFFFIFSVGLFFQIYSVPYSVIIDDELNTLEIKYLMSRNKVVGVHDISAFSTTTIKSWSSNCYGIFIYLSNGKFSNKKKVLISDLNLSDYMPVELFLKSLNVKELGEERFSLYS